MLFNSLDFAVFLPVVFFVYWFVLGNRTRWQNVFVVAASVEGLTLWDVRSRRGTYDIVTPSPV